MAEDTERLRAQQSYELMLIEGLMLTEKEASGQGLLAEYEDVVESLWAAVPTQKKVDIQIWNADLSAKVSALQCWQEACGIQPPADMPDARKPTHRSNKERSLRKKQILIDVLAAMKLLYREPMVGRMMEDDDGDPA
jgi:hypothetical protein